MTLVERGELTSGTTGRHHGLLHSGGRYAVKDRESAIECIEENRILRRICPGSFELNDGLFALTLAPLMINLARGDVVAGDRAQTWLPAPSASVRDHVGLVMPR